MPSSIFQIFIVSCQSAFWELEEAGKKSTERDVKEKRWMSAMISRQYLSKGRMWEIEKQRQDGDKVSLVQGVLGPEALETHIG